MHILIIGCGGSDAVTLTLRDSLEKHGELCEIMDCLSFISTTLSQTLSRSQELLFRHMADLTDAEDELAGHIEPPAKSRGIRKLLSLGLDDLARFLRGSDYDLVVCTHFFAAIMLSDALEKYKLRVKYAVFCPNSARTSALTSCGADLYIVTTERQRRALLDAGVSDEKLLVCAFSESGDKTNTEGPGSGGADLPSESSEGSGSSRFYSALRDIVQMPSPAAKIAAPVIQSTLRHHILKMPEAVYEASGIVINGRRIKSFVFSTDLAIIRNCDADAVFAVYPFTPQQAISEAIIKAAYVPVFCGVGGGTTKGVRTVGLAKDAEAQGAMGLVLNAPISNPNLRAVALAVDIPVVITVVSEETSIARRLEAGASIINVAAAADTPELVRKIRARYPELPIIASGGNSAESIRETIRAGANAITYTPPSTKDLFRVTMSKYRES